MMIKSKTLCADIARALRTGHYERSPGGIFLAAQGLQLGGYFESSQDGEAWHVHKNTVTLEFLDKMLSDWFNGGSPPSGFYIALFTNGVSPSSALTAATFAGTQGEYIGQTQTTRVLWVPNGNAASQAVSNSASPAEFTIGASAVTIRGAGLLTASAKGATSGVAVAASLFDAANTQNPGSTIKIKYTLAAAPAA